MLTIAGSCKFVIVCYLVLMLMFFTLILVYIFREEKELTVKQSKQSMESSKAVMNDKTIKAKAERER